ncbi:MAG: leucine-rich repeat domain-containing protein [Defluviitaleaceae bacterium]|nr:leucine-rich repeat domain-containing protein [Defluviitaleaceae bacterium]
MQNGKALGILFIAVMLGFIIVVLVISNNPRDFETPEQEGTATTYQANANENVTTTEETTPTPPAVEFIMIQGERYNVSLTELDLRLSELTDEDIVQLHYMVNLESLMLGGNEITDISSLADLTRLRTLGLWRNKIADISQLERLVNLNALYLDDNQITDISPLEGLINLTILTIHENEISDLSPLANLTRLEGLTINDNQISDLSPLSNLHQLNWINASNNPISDLSPLASIPMLEELRIEGLQISDISPLAGMNHLWWLFADNNEISDITPLAGLTTATVIGLNNNQISDLSPLAGLTNLNSLGLDENEISDLSPLAGIESLTSVFLAYNQISNISPLAELHNLVTLNLMHNEISDLSPLSGLNLYGLVVAGNPITDWSPVSHILLVYDRVPVSGQVVYALSKDMVIQSHEVGRDSRDGSIFHSNDFGWSPFLMQAGSPRYTISETPYGHNGIHVGNREQTWYALDLTLPNFLSFDDGEEYDIVVRGRNASDFDMAMAIAAMDGPWNWLYYDEVPAGENFEIGGILSYAILEATDGGSYQFMQRGFRIQSVCTNPFVVYEIVVTRR